LDIGEGDNILYLLGVKELLFVGELEEVFIPGVVCIL
jgi:hypothetical protein